MIEDRDFWLWLTRIRGLSKNDIRILLKHFYSPKEIFMAESSALNDEVFEKYKLDIDKKEFLNSRDIKYIENYKKELFDKGINYVSVDDDDYPYRLHSLYDRAYLLYYKGKLRRDRLNIAVVGARKCSEYARSVAFNISRDLAKIGVNVISGLAYGIDSSAHLGALEAEGFTTAVVGGGFDYCYPASNRRLMERIVENGIVFSEYPPSYPPQRHTFPERNRIISGLSDGILVVEARKRSGSLITVNHALDIGRDVFAVPLDVLGRSNEGGNQVIRDGGKVVFNYEDILESYPLFLESLNLKKEFSENIEDFSANDILSGLSIDEKRVYESIGYNPIDLEYIIEKTGMGLSNLQLILMKLEIMDLIKALSNKRYLRKS